MLKAVTKSEVDSKAQPILQAKIHHMGSLRERKKTLKSPTLLRPSLTPATYVRSHFGEAADENGSGLMFHSLSLQTLKSQYPLMFTQIPEEEIAQFQLRAQPTELKKIPTIEVKPEDSSKNPLKPGTGLSKSIFTVEFIVLWYVIFIVPLKLSFYLHGEISGAARSLEWLVKLFLFVQFILRFFTPIYINYELETNKRLIFQKLVKRPTFYLDFYAMIPWREILFDGIEVQQSLALSTIVYSSMMACLYKMAFHIVDYNKETSENLIWYFLKKNSSKRTKDAYLPAFIIVLSLTHFYACLFYYVGTNVQGENSWLTLLDKENKGMIDEYIACLYFVVQTFSTTGYGDFPATTNSERLVRCLFVMTGLVVYALSTGEANVFLTKLITWKELTNRKMVALKELNSIFVLDPFVVAKVETQILDKRKMDHMVTNRHGDLVYADQNRNRLDFRNLSKEEVECFYFSLFMKKYKGIKMFQTYDSEFLLELGAAVFVKEFKADNIIYTKDEPAANMFIIAEGSVGYMLNRFDNVPFMRIDKGYFGEYELVNNVNRIFTVRALTDVSLYYVSIEAFKKIFLADRDPDFISLFTFQASDRMNFFNQIHNKFDLHIKNQLARTETFKSVQKMLATAFKTAMRRNNKNIKKNTKLTLFNLAPTNENVQKLPKREARKSLQLDAPTPSMFSIEEPKFSSPGLKPKNYDEETPVELKNPALSGFRAKKSVSEVDVTALAAFGGPRHQVVPQCKFKLEVKPTEELGNIIEQIDIHQSTESRKGASDLDSNEHDSDSEEEVVEMKEIEKSSQKNRPSNKSQARISKVDLDPKVPNNSNPLFLAFHSLFQSRSREEKQDPT